MMRGFSQRLDYSDIMQTIIRLRRQYRADRVVIEKAVCGYTLSPALKATAGFTPVMVLVEQRGEHAPARGPEWISEYADSSGGAV